MNIEEIKFSLMRTFGDSKNKDVFDFLKRVVGIDTKLGSYSNYVFNPIYLPKIGLLVNIRRLKDKTENEHHQIVFSVFESPNKKYFELKVGETHQAVDIHQRSITIRDDLVCIQNLGSQYKIDDKYALIKVDRIVVNEIAFDIINKKVIRSVENEKFDNALRRLRNILEPLSNSKSDWSKEVKDACDKNPLFAKAAQECDLASLIDVNGVALPALYAYVVRPSVMHLTSHPELRKPFFDYLVAQDLSDGAFVNKIESLFCEGDCAYEVLGINKLWVSEIALSGRNLSIPNIKGFADMLQSIERFIPIGSTETVRKIAALIGISPQSTSANTIGELTWLYKKGYSIDDMYSYLQIIDIKQGVDLKKAFHMFYYVVRKHYFLTGDSGLFYPEYLQIEDNLQNREIKRIFNHDSFRREDHEDILNRVFDYRRNLVGQYESIIVSCDLPEKSNYRPLAEARLRDTDELYISRHRNKPRKNKKEEVYALRLNGHSVSMASERFPKDLIPVLVEWCNHHGLIIAGIPGLRGY